MKQIFESNLKNEMYEIVNKTDYVY